MMNVKLVLASGSPRRRELLALLGVPFHIKVSEAEEVITSSNPAKVTEELSRQKAEAVAEELLREMTEDQSSCYIILGADTVVAADGEILGKPKNREDARQMISLLQGRTHMVYTGVTLLFCQNGQKENLTFSEGTKVKVAPMSEKEIEDYIDTDEPYDKAGAYGIQGAFSKYIEGIEGDYFNVVGLPVHRVYEEMKKSGAIAQAD
jgi:septum formation protein